MMNMVRDMSEQTCTENTSAPCFSRKCTVADVSSGVFGAHTLTCVSGLATLNAIFVMQRYAWQNTAAELVFHACLEGEFA
jgi:hypothetical protein